MAATAVAPLVPTGGRILTDEQRGLVQAMVSRRICAQAELLHLLHTIRGDATPQPTAASTPARRGPGAAMASLRG